ncbi:MAG: HmuY family protein [Myxococcota bacterium]
MFEQEAGKFVLWCLFLCCGLFGMLACAPSLVNPDQKPDDLKLKTIPGKVLAVAEVDGFTQMRVNASNQEQWVYVDVVQKKVLPVEKAENDRRWHLGFRRYFIKTNSGSSGSGEVRVALIQDRDFAAFQEPPQSGFATDQAGGKPEEPQSVFRAQGEWYYYDLWKHVLTPRPEFFYVVQIGKVVYKMQMLGYYDENGNSGFPSFRVKRLKD